MTAKNYIEGFQMLKHPEGGYYKEVYRHQDAMETPLGLRSYATSIYFLIEEGDASNFHQLKSDEMWYFHGGMPLSVVIIEPNGQLRVENLGLDLSRGQQPQVLVPAGSIFGSFVQEGFALVGCMVSPGFDFKDFHLFSRSELIKLYPQHQAYIMKLTREE